MKKALRIILLVFLSAAFIALYASAANDIQCYFLNSTTCPSPTYRLMGYRNDTNGTSNAHVQNNSFATYNSICCNNSNTSVNITTACPGNVTVVRLANSTSSHVETANNSNYLNTSACLGSNVTQVRCVYNYSIGTCPAGYACILTMASSESSNNTNAHIGNCTKYNQTVCCGLGNSAPAKPTLLTPSNNNGTVFFRIPFLNWTNVSDPDGNSVNYTVNITCLGVCSACNVYTQVTATNYTPTSPLCHDKQYNWTINACDTYGACNSSDMWNFTINSTIGFDLAVNVTTLGTLNPSSTNSTNNTLNTLGGTPLVGNNSGNVIINVSINATKLFTRADMNSNNYMFMISVNESGSYNSACSQTTYQTMGNETQKWAICNLTSENIAPNSNNSAKIHLNVTVPNDESSGTKNSTIQLTATISDYIT
jgi:hypothetical protein